MKYVLDHLHLGCGLTAPDGWLNVDGSVQVILAQHQWLKRLVVALRLLPARQAAIPWSPRVRHINLTRPLPFADASFAAVYSSHVLEHLHHAHALALLLECRRVLRPGGTCRAVVPDIEAIVERYRSAKAQGGADAADRMMEEMLVHDRSPPRGLRGAYYRFTAFHQHKWMYDADSLMQLFRQAGFTAVRPAGYLDSRIERIGEVEDPGRMLDGQGVAVEGIRA
jgi:SAM-dependent methyltransferase